MRYWSLSKRKELKIISDNVDEEIIDIDSVKIKISHICIESSDVARFNGHEKQLGYPVSLGRSAIGQISESLDQNYRKGQKVFLSPYFADNKIAGMHKNGYLSEYVNVNVKDLIEIPEVISDEQSLFIDDISLILASLENYSIEEGQKALFVGASCKNCIAYQILKNQGMECHIADDDEDRISVAKNLGIENIINLKEKEKTLEFMENSNVDIVFYDADAAIKYQDMFLFIKSNGVAIMYAFSKNNKKQLVNISPIINKQVHIFSNVSGSGFVKSAVNLLINEKIVVKGLINNAYTFNNTVKLFKRLSTTKSYYKDIIVI